MGTTAHTAASNMPAGTSPAKAAALSLAQKFAYRPAGPAAAEAVTTAVNDRKRACDGEQASSSKAGSISGSPESTKATAANGVHKTAVQEVTPWTIASAGSSTSAIGKKRKLASSVDAPRSASTSTSTSTTATATAAGSTASASSSASVLPQVPADVLDTAAAAAAFEKSLSDKPLPGQGGDLSERDLLRLELETLHPSWLSVLQKDLKSPHFLKLKRFLWAEGVKSAGEASKTIFPPAREIYSWSRLTPLPNVRVVVLGQDPYHNEGQAHGLCFSVRSNVKTPPSLKNIYKEIKNDYPQFSPPNHGYLGSWARQGVLLINTSMTVRAHQANSHSKKGWEEFTDSVLRAIDARPGPGVVFLAWGQPALKRINATITQKGKKHLVLSSVHPSPLSASRGFFGNAHFRKTNDWLVKQYGDENAAIDWCTLEPESANV